MTAYDFDELAAAIETLDDSIAEARRWINAETDDENVTTALCLMRCRMYRIAHDFREIEDQIDFLRQYHETQRMEGEA